MPIETALVITLIVAVFSVFAAALAYGEYQTRHFKRAPEASIKPETSEHRWLKAA